MKRILMLLLPAVPLKFTVGELTTVQAVSSSPSFRSISIMPLPPPCSSFS